jgi:hypothetical protein
MSTLTTLTRRTFLRGMLGGASISLGLPALEAFLNTSGTAWADGAPLPQRFGTWFWGCGMNPARWNPTESGTGWQLTEELAAVAPIREHLNILSGFNVNLDGHLNHPHGSGVVGMLTGVAPEKPKDVPAPSLDILISDEIGGATRFRSLEMSASGSVRHSYSMRNASNRNPAEVSPLALYTRVFGPDFRDPNAAEFAPDPKVMLRKSVVSAVSEDRDRLAQQLGASDRLRLDEYLTSLRQLERQLEVQLSEPPPLAACRTPEAPEQVEVGSEVGQAMRNHELMTDVLALALACDQTRVFNMVFSYGASNLHKEGDNTGHHQLTHEEPVDAQLGYQPRATFFVDRSMEAWTAFVQKLAAIEEGDGTLLDNCLVMAHSETSFAKVHDVLGLPVMTAGRAGGRMKVGQHIPGANDPVTRIGLTVQQLMGLGKERWGTRSMETSKPVSELFA